jgi:hypothetical protein
MSLRFTHFEIGCKKKREKTKASYTIAFSFFQQDTNSKIISIRPHLNHRQSQISNCESNELHSIAWNLAPVTLNNISPITPCIRLNQKIKQSVNKHFYANSLLVRDWGFSYLIDTRAGFCSQSNITIFSLVVLIRKG